MSHKPKSLVMDLFGEYLRYTHGEAYLGSLIKLLGAFGVEPTTGRMALSRMKKQGWFETRRDGRETIYTLSPAMMDVLIEGRERIFNRSEQPWSGRWTLVLYQVPESERSTREALRKSLTWLGFGQLSPSTWLAAHDLLTEAQDLIEAHPDAQVDVMWTHTGSLSKDRDLAARCWDLEELALDYERFMSKYSTAERRHRRGDLSAEEAFVMRTELAADARRFTFRDPRLPLELQPANWPGRTAYELFRRLHAELGPNARSYVESVIGISIDNYPKI